MCTDSGIASKCIGSVWKCMDSGIVSTSSDTASSCVGSGIVWRYVEAGSALKCMDSGIVSTSRDIASSCAGRGSVWRYMGIGSAWRNSGIVLSCRDCRGIALRFLGRSAASWCSDTVATIPQAPRRRSLWSMDHQVR